MNTPVDQHFHAWPPPVAQYSFLLSSSPPRAIERRARPLISSHAFATLSSFCSFASSIERLCYSVFLFCIVPVLEHPVRSQLHSCEVFESIHRLCLIDNHVNSSAFRFRHPSIQALHTHDCLGLLG
ncbi:hypothetical protein K491DRAFT_403719 [Lophiostoma macrostomum CBS 122681]|uniref:Uncharacterized protein n=1 Tax=Lophiostoma macrostomum CBS 122681 TaxID=1314788 RepID=A0A6A6T8C7_9PLEO|nr:hypothetical protein K491DRAFT_403719 [Lophiostoma macrostomum CBS 122681]